MPASPLVFLFLKNKQTVVNSQLFIFGLATEKL